MPCAISRGGAVALHAGRRTTMWSSPKRRPMTRSMSRIGGAARRGHDADLAREARQRRACGPRSNSPSAVQPRLELLEGELQGAEPLRLQQLDDQLVLAALRRRPRRRRSAMHVQAVARLEADAPRAVAEQHAAQLRALVLEREVGVAGAVDLEVGDLALDPHRRKPLLHAPRASCCDSWETVRTARSVIGPRRRAGVRPRRACCAGASPRSSGRRRPGTGVIACARGLTASKSTSPTQLAGVAAG